MGGTATGVAAVGEGVCVAALLAELDAGCGAVVTIVYRRDYESAIS